MIKIFFNVSLGFFKIFLLQPGNKCKVNHSKNLNNNCVVKKCDFHIYWKLKNIDTNDPCFSQKNVNKI